MKSIFVLFICVMMIMSCDNNSKLSEEILLFQKKSVLLTKQSLLITKEEEEIITNDVQKGLKYIIYKDSLDCTSCAINRMYFWNDFIKYEK